MTDRPQPVRGPEEHRDPAAPDAVAQLHHHPPSRDDPPAAALPDNAVPETSVPAISIPEISVVVPVHNEADNLLPLLAAIDAALQGIVAYELIVVDDGSTDDTPRLLDERAHAHPTLRPLRHLRNSGQSAALATGVRAARARWIATLDGDGQNDPADIPALLTHLRASAAAQPPAMIAGWRVQRRDTWLKRISSKIANAVRGRILRDRTPDAGCGLKLFRRDIFLRLPQFDHMHRFLPALFQRAGGSVVSVPVSHRARARGRSHYGLHDRLWVGLVDILGVLWLGRRMRCTDVVDLAHRCGSGAEDARAETGLPSKPPTGPGDPRADAAAPPTIETAADRLAEGGARAPSAGSGATRRSR